MNQADFDPTFAGDWDAYWNSAQDAALPARGGAQDKALSVFWTKFFRAEFPRHDRPRLLDAACGSGAVTGFALEVANSIASVEVAVSCMDYSESAIKAVEKKYPGVRGVACDAGAMPFANGDFDIVASQFGLEYAGTVAFDEATRLVAKGGVLVAIVHMKKGAIFDECAENLSAIHAIQEARLMPLARGAFDAGFAVAAGNAPQSAFREADRMLAPAVECLKETLARYGPLAAGGLIQRLGQDLAQMYQRIEAYVPQEVLHWLNHMEKEVAAYAGRMQSMVNAALDESEIRNLSARLTDAGLTLDTYDVLRMRANKEPAAWILVGRRIS